MKQPILSIIIPWFERLSEIQRLKSEISFLENNQFVEVIIVNDGSSKIVNENLKKSFNSLNFSIINIPNSGGSFARNTGILNSHGKYLMFLDNDDSILNIDLLVKELKDIDVQTSLIHLPLLNQENHIIYTPPNIIELKGLLEGNLWPSTQCWVWNRDFIEEIGFWTNQLICKQDYNIIQKALLKDPKIWLLNFPISKFQEKSDEIRVSLKAKSFKSIKSHWIVFKTFKQAKNFSLTLEAIKHLVKQLIYICFS